MRAIIKNRIHNYESGAYIVSINKRKRESNNKIIDVCVRTYTNYEIYNCIMRDYIASNYVCIDVDSIISKGEKENDNKSINVRVQAISNINTIIYDSHYKN